jgi:hypothetical protein
VNQIDLNTPPPGHQYSVSVEREETDGERRVRLFKEVILFLVGGHIRWNTLLAMH